MKEWAGGDILYARRTRMMKLCSSDARSGERPHQPTMCVKLFGVETGKKVQ
jgi:hypothetical protein